MDTGASIPLLKHHSRPNLGQSPSILPLSTPPPYNPTNVLDSTPDSYSRLATRQYGTPNFSASGREFAVDKRRYQRSADALAALERKVEASQAHLNEAKAIHAGNEAALKLCQEAHDEVAAEITRTQDRILLTDFLEGLWCLFVGCLALAPVVTYFSIVAGVFHYPEYYCRHRPSLARVVHTQSSTQVSMLCILVLRGLVIALEPCFRSMTATTMRQCFWLVFSLGVISWVATGLALHAPPDTCR